MRKIIFILLLFSNIANAQEQVSYAEIDSATYADYMKNDFKKIRKTGRKALRNSVDFYYLRMRLGIIGYNHKNYEYALSHFKVAYDMFPADTVAQEYLYYTYLFSNRTESANALASSFSDLMQIKVGYKVKRIESFSVGLAYFQNLNYDKNKQIDFIAPSYNRGETNLNGDAFGQNIMIQSLRSKRYRYYNKLSVFESSTLGIEQFRIPAVKQMVKYTNLQYQYNWAMTHVSKKERLFGIGLAYFHTSTSDLDARPSFGGTIYYEEADTNYNNFLFSVTFGKRYKYFMPVISGTYSNLYTQTQLQGELSLTYYPMGNVNLYGTSSFSIISNNTKINHVISQKIGFKCTNWLWFEGKISIGNHQNYMTSNGFISYNTLDPIMKNASLDMHLYIKKFELVIGYSNQRRVGHYKQYMSPTIYSNTNFTYNNNNLTTTLKWNF